MNIKIVALAGLAATALWSGAAAQEAVAGDVIDPADMAWERVPSGDEVTRFYPLKTEPPEAARTAMRCTVAEDRRLKDCVVLGENPEGYGFGAAQLKLATKFRAAATTKSGQPTVGRKVLLKMTWRSRP